MKSRWTTAFVLILSTACCLAGVSLQEQKPPPVVGRWDIVVQDPQGEYPSWLEVKQSGRSTLVGQFVGRFGSARPIGEVFYREGRLEFSLPPQWEQRKEREMKFTAAYENDRLTGVTTTDGGREVPWTAGRAPKLKAVAEPVWGEPIELFNGTDLKGWKTRWRERPNGWIVSDGALANERPGNDLLTERTFRDFKLRAEFRYPRGSNSGIYLRGRYEMQIEDDAAHPEDEPSDWPLGSIYGFLKPNQAVARGPEEWQTVEITLLGRIVTVVLNGMNVIDRQEIPGITGGALDSREGEPGPILLQGDHGRVQFRRITLIPAI